MAAKSYLGRIAAPLAPGEAALAPLRTAAAEDARVPQEVVAAPVARRPIKASAPDERVPAAPKALSPSSESKRTVPEPVPAPVEPATPEIQAADRIERPALDRPAAPAPRRAPPPVRKRQAQAAELQATPAAKLEPSGWPAPGKAAEADPALKVRIGVLEVRTSPPPKPERPAPPARTPAQRSGAAAAPAASPLARGLGWRFGLIQG